VRWFFTDLDFQKHESIINSREWDEDKGNDYLLGEQLKFGWNYNGAEHVPGLIGGHECGEESDFISGQPWPYDGPDIEYGEDWIPLCCPREIIPDVQAGTQVETTEAKLYKKYPTAGASVDYLLPPPPVLSVTAGASVDVPIIMPTVQAGASVDYLSSHSLPADVQAGAVAELVGLSEHAQAGASPDAGTSGIGVTGGAAPDALFETPNPTCELALPMTLGGSIDSFVNVGGPCKWWKIPTTDPGFMESILTYNQPTPGPATGTVSYYSGPDCDHLTLDSVGELGFFAHLWFHSQVSPIWIKVCPTDKDVAFTIMTDYAPT
jgi:hypothetical protein